MAIICELIGHYIQGLSSNPNKGKKVGTPNLWPYKIHSSFILSSTPPFLCPFVWEKWRNLLCGISAFLHNLQQRLKSETPLLNFHLILFQILYHSAILSWYFGILFAKNEEFLLLRKQLVVNIWKLGSTHYFNQICYQTEDGKERHHKSQTLCIRVSL